MKTEEGEAGDRVPCLHTTNPPTFPLNLSLSFLHHLSPKTTCGFGTGAPTPTHQRPAGGPLLTRHTGSPAGGAE